MPTRLRGELYVAIPDAYVDLEPLYLLNVPSPSGLSNVSNLFLSGDAEHEQDVWRVGRSDQAVAFSISYLAACRDGVSNHRSTHRHIQCSGLGVIVTIAPAIRDLVH